MIPPINRDPAALFPPFRARLEVHVNGWNAAHPAQTVGLFEGLRTFERQGYLYSLGRSVLSTSPCYHAGHARAPGKCLEHPLGGIVTNAPPGMSWHQYGMAGDRVFDADPVRPGLQATWDGRFPWDAAGAHAEGEGLEWAGRWRRMREQPHLQMTFGLQLTEALELYRQGGLQAVWDAAQ